MMRIKIITIFACIVSLIYFSQAVCLDYDYTKLDGQENLVRVLVIGSGPAGLSAAIAAARAGLKPYVITGQLVGGLLTGSTEVENMPGVAKASGLKIMDEIYEQAQGFGVGFIQESVERVDFSAWPFSVTTESGLELQALSVIIATGSQPRRLGIPGEDEYWGAGVSACAVCDGFMYEGGKVAVVGGGDSAINHALDLAPYAESITIFVRRDRMRAIESMRSQLFDYKDKIHVEYNKKIIKVIGVDGKVVALKVQSTLDDEVMIEDFDGLFLAIGHEPNTSLFVPYIELDSSGYIYLASRSQETNVRGVFSAGDVSSPRYRQATIAVAEGTIAAFEAVDFLREIGLSGKTSGNFYSN